MAPKRATRSTPVTTTPAPTATSHHIVTNAPTQQLIDQGVPAALAHIIKRNGDDSHTSGTGGRRTKRIVRECTYQDFMKCKPLHFKGTEGVVELIQWFKRIETVFRISNCSVENQINHDVAYAMTWADLRKKMTDKYCPRNEMKKLEAELMFPEESDKIERYIGGLPDMIHGNINKRQNTGRAYTTRTGEKKPYGGSKPLCAKCNYHHDGTCALKCHKCNKVSHFARDWHFKRECPKLKNNNNRGNQVGGGNAPAKVYTVGHVGTNLDSNVVMGTFLLNNCYASILFDIGADRSFVSTAFSSQIDITPTAL
ncbi:hypothetical protein Tco_1257484 [Tanacetum coccineum]